MSTAMPSLPVEARHVCSCCTVCKIVWNTPDDGPGGQPMVRAFLRDPTGQKWVFLQILLSVVLTFYLESLVLEHRHFFLPYVSVFKE